MFETSSSNICVHSIRSASPRQLMSGGTLAKIIAIALFAPFSGAEAYAQTDASASTLQESGTASASVGDIVVTAQRRSERLQDVPIAVNAVSGDRLAAAGINDLQALNTLVPGFNSVNSVGSFRPSIRGIATGSDVVENAVSLYIDGVYMPNQREGLRELADIEQITVLKGPQGTLFGRNATAGVVQITTQRPRFNIAGRASAGYDNYGTFRGKFYVTGPLSDKVAASVSTSYISQGEGYGRSVTAGFDTYKLKHDLALRGKLLFAPSDRTDITLIGDYQYREDSGTNYQPYPGTRFSVPGFGPTSSRYDTYSSTPGFNKFDGGGASIEVDHDLDFAKFISISSYRHGISRFRFDLLNIESPDILSNARVVSESYSQEVQLISPSRGDFRWVAGVFYFHNKLGYDRFINNFSGAFAATPTSTSVQNTYGYETAESIAPFAQADYEILPSTTITLGARWTYEKRSIRGNDTITRVNGAVAVSPVTTPDTLTVKEPTWRAAINYKPSDDMMLYASYSRGFKSGGFNIGRPFEPGYLPEKLDAGEIGLKTELLDRRLTLNLSGFYYDYKNLQVVTFVGLTARTTNGAQSEIYGLDMDFQAKVSDALSLSGGFELMHAKFTDYKNASISSARPTGGNLIVPGDATGNRLPLAQKFVGTLAIDYDQPIGSINSHFNLTGTYNGDYYFEADNVLRQPSYVMLNSSLRLSDSSDRLSLTFAVSNILNEKIIARVATNSIGYRANWGNPPRLYSITAGLKF